MERIEIRSLIRAVIAEELGQDHKGISPPAKTLHEPVTITNDQELAAFVQRIAALSRDGNKRTDLETGRHAFTLCSGSLQVQQANGSPAEPCRADRIAEFDKDFINERQIDALSDEVAVVLVAKTVRFTPLAKDRLRQRSIKIERKAS